MSKPEYFQERRIFPRFTIQIPVSYADPSIKQTVNTYTHNISVEGLGLLVDTPLTCGTILEVCLRMTDNGEEIITKGKVIWRSLIQDRYRVGVKLDGPQLQPIPMVLRIIQSRLNFRSSSQ